VDNFVKKQGTTWEEFGFSGGGSENYKVHGKLRFEALLVVVGGEYTQDTVVMATKKSKICHLFGGLFHARMQLKNLILVK
jgi:hypothetical protein